MDCEAVVRVLERCTPLVYAHLVLSSSVIDKLRDDEVISDSVVKKMKNLDTEGQITLLLEILRKRGSSTFKRFLGVLKKTFHGTLADKLVLCDPVRFSDALLLDPGPYHPPPETINLAYPTGEFFDPKINTNVYVTTPTEKADSVKANEENQNGDTFNFREKPKSFLQEGKEDVDVDDELSRMRAYFENQQSSTAKVLSALKQEEVVIRELLDQNAKEQEQFRQNRSTLEEINRRVREISSRTGYLADAAPRLSVSDFRLATLNSLPWTAGKTEN